MTTLMTLQQINYPSLDDARLAHKLARILKPSPNPTSISKVLIAGSMVSSRA